MRDDVDPAPLADDAGALRKHSVRIAGHLTSFTLEQAFWIELKRLAKERKRSLASLVLEVDANRTGNLSSALRLFVLRAIKIKGEKSCVDRGS